MAAKGLEKILVTGGAGFIGSHTVELLTNSGYQVVMLDNLEPQVHGTLSNVPDYLNDNATFVKGSLGDYDLLRKLLVEADAVVHLAALVGIGQSMYQVKRYVETNTGGTANLLDILANEEHSVRKLIVASSMSIYGEGKYLCEKCASYAYPSLRSQEQLKNGLWDHLCPSCGSLLSPVPTDENKPSIPTSVYAMSKRHQEELSLLMGKTYGIRTVALRYFNVYGSRQALSNPYTGACAIFLSRVLNGKPPYMFEDGNQMRDFVHVKDVAQANLSALKHSNADYTVINVGTGSPISIRTLAEMLIQLTGSDVRPYVSSEYRSGDIRHCYADISRAQKLLEYRPAVRLEDGLLELMSWARTYGKLGVDLFDRALDELKERRLAGSALPNPPKPFNPMTA